MMAQAANLLFVLETSVTGDREMMMETFVKAQLLNSQEGTRMKNAAASAMAFIAATEKGVELPAALLAALQGQE
jgi:hypothetical protein